MVGLGRGIAVCNGSNVVLDLLYRGSQWSFPLEMTVYGVAFLRLGYYLIIQKR